MVVFGCFVFGTDFLGLQGAVLQLRAYQPPGNFFVFSAFAAIADDPAAETVLIQVWQPIIQ